MLGQPTIEHHFKFDELAKWTDSKECGSRFSVFTEVDGSRLPRDLFIVSKMSSQDFVLKILETENLALVGEYEITYGVGFANYP